MSTCKPTQTPFQWGVTLTTSCTSTWVNPSMYQQLVGSILYLTHTKPDIAFVVGLVSRFCHDPHKSHWKAVKCILRYITGTIRFGIQYSIGSLELVSFKYFNWVGSVDDWKSTSRFLYHFGYAPIAWSCKKQSTIALYSAEDEYRAAVLASHEVLWIQKLLTEFGIS